MPLYATYERDGTIVSLSELGEVPEGVPQVVVAPTDDREVAELELDDETRNLDHGELIQRYRIDPESKRLVRRQD